MPNIDYITERENDFLKAYSVITSTFENDRKETFLKKVIHQKAARFYVSEEECYRNLLRLKKKLPLKIRSRSKQLMYQEIHKRVNHVLSINKNISLPQAVRMVIYEGAPQFYISLRTAQRILKNYRDRKKGI